MFHCLSKVRSQLALLGAALLAVYLIVRHGLHVVSALPVLVLLVCPLMHVFLHADHGGHRLHRPAAHPQSRASAASRADTVGDLR